MSVRQFIKLLAFISISFLVCFCISKKYPNISTPIVDELLSFFYILITAIFAMSFPFFAYVDNIAKDLTDLRNEVDREKYKDVQDKISDLKREIVFNAALILSLFFIERAVKSGSTYLIAHMPKNIDIITLTATSTRFAILITMTYAIFTQIKGLVIAVEYRELIAKNRK